MNNKLLICGVLATGLLLTACVKKEPPKEEEQQPAQTTQQQPATPKPAEFENLDTVPASTADAQIPTRVEVNRTETNNTTTEVRREYREPAPVRSQPAEPRHETRTTERTEAAPAPKAEAVRAVATEVTDTPKAETAQAPKRSNTEAQTQDDAVAAAIAAATPALDN